VKNGIKRVLRDKDFQYLTKNGKFKIALSLIINLSGFALIWFLANHTAKEFFGNYQYIIAMMSLFLVFSYPGIKDAIIQSVARGYDSSLTRGTKRSLVHSIIGSVAFLLVATYQYAVRHNPDLAVAFMVCALFFPYYYTFQNVMWYLDGKKQFRKEFFYHGLIMITHTATMIGAVLVFKQNLFLLIMTFFVSQVPFYLFYYLREQNMIRSRKKDTDLYSYGSFMNKITILTTIFLQLDKVLIGVFIGPVSLAIYSVAVMIPKKVQNLLIKSSFTVLTPHFASGHMHLTMRKVWWTLAASAAMFITFYSLLPITVRLLFPDYIDSIGYSLYYSIIILVYPVSVLFEHYFRAMKNKKALRSIKITGNIIAVVIMIPLLYFFGLYGLITAQIIGVIIQILYGFYWFRKEPAAQA